MDRTADAVFGALENGKCLHPAFVLDGKEWHYGKLPEAAAETPGVLKVTVNGERVSVWFNASPGVSDRFDIHVARLGFSFEDRRDRGGE